MSPADLGPVGLIPIVGPILEVGLAIVSVLGAIFGFGGGGNSADAAIRQLSNQLASVTRSLTKFIWSIGYALGLLLQWIHDLLVGLLQSIWTLLKRLAALVRTIVTDLIPRLLRIIRNMRALLQQVYQKYIRPALAWIQYARQWLAILRIFHVGWATKLDSWLVKLQGRIIAPYLYVLRSINGIGTWVNLVVTVTGLIQRPVFLNTMYAYQADWINMWWVGQSSTGVGVPPTSAPPPVLPPTQAQVTSDFSAWVTADAGTYATVAARAQALVAGA
jgi:hypothetical protein